MAAPRQPLRRGQACIPCASRKRKCDARQPTCENCEHFDRECVYGKIEIPKVRDREHQKEPSLDSNTSLMADDAPSTTAMNVEERMPGSAEGSNRRESRSRPATPPPPPSRVRDGEQRSGLSAWQPSPFIAFAATNASISPTTTPSISAAPTQPISNDDMPHLSEDGLPPLPLQQELWTTFFERWHRILPCLHKDLTMAQVVDDGPLTEPNHLTFAVLALAGYHDDNAGVRAASHLWAARAKDCFDRAIAEGPRDLELVQAGIYLCIRLFGICQMSQLWVLQSSVSRLCISLNLNLIDSGSPRLWGLDITHLTALEIEEIRRTAWAAFILDRLVSSSVPWSVCIADADFRVNFPVSEQLFQAGTKQTFVAVVTEPFPDRLDLLKPMIARMATGAPRDPLYHLCVLTVMLGNIMGLIRSRDPSYRDFEALHDALGELFHVTLEPYEDLAAVDPSHLPTVMFLGCITLTSAVFLHSPNSRSRALVAADDVVNLMAAVMAMSGDHDDYPFANPMLSPAILITAKALSGLLRTLDRGEGAGLSQKREILMAAVERMRTWWPPLAREVKELILSYFRDDGAVAGGGQVTA